MKKMFTYLAVMSVLLTSAQPAMMQPVFAQNTTVAAEESEQQLKIGFNRITEDTFPGTAGPTLTVLEGSFTNGTETVTFSNCETYHAEFSRLFADQPLETGDAYIELMLYESGKKEYYYNLYTEDGTRVASYLFTGLFPVDELQIVSDGITHLLRVGVLSENPLMDIAGVYHEDGEVHKKLTLRNNGTYTMEYYKGSEVSKKENGTVKIEKPEESTFPLCCLYDADNKLVYSFQFGVETPVLNLHDVDDAHTFVRDVNAVPDEDASPADIAGHFFYQELDETGQKFVEAGYLDVYEDGSYIYQKYGEEKTVSGTVTVSREYHPDGSTTPWYIFTQNNGGVWIECTKSANPDEWSVGNGGMARLNMDRNGEDDEALRINWGACTGKWFLQKDGKKDTYLLVDEKGSFMMYQGSETAGGGQITVHLDMNPDGTYRFIYKFVEWDETLLAEGMLSDDGNTFDCSQDGSFRMVRDETVRKASGTEIKGEWILKQRNYEEEGAYNEIGRVNVMFRENDFSAIYTYRDFETNELTQGTVFASYYLDTNGAVTVGYDFYDQFGNLWFACNSTGTPGKYTIGQMDAMLLVRDYQAAGSGDVDGNGTVDLKDALSALQAYSDTVLMGLENPLTPEQTARADIDRNGTVSMTDALSILLIYSETLFRQQ